MKIKLSNIPFTVYAMLQNRYFFVGDIFGLNKTKN